MYQDIRRYARLPVLFVLLLAGFVIPKSNAQVPKREFRAVWVSTVANIDWPTRPGLSSAEQQAEIIRILDRHQENGINAIILQVRPTADAIYASGLEPWSRFLNGKQGVAPEPYYDPLEFWIREAHRRGMELHAWFNPYRISLNEEPELAEGHMALQNHDWTFTYGGRMYYSPAHPRVWDFLTEVVTDVVRRYDIDAVHFDDYFYPYQVAGELLPDSLEFELLGGKYYPDRLEDWRRKNVDTIIHRLAIAIKAEKPWVKFGISPFGVWRNHDLDPRGSETRAGTTNYDGLYADVIRWQEEGWIDYLMPQLYWRDDHPAAGFSTLASWWNDFHFGRALYVGLAPYRIDRKSEYKSWRKDKYFLEQIEMTRRLEGIQGFGYFSSKHFFRKDLGKLNRKLQSKFCPQPALVPLMPWIDAQAPVAPFGLELRDNTLIWDTDSISGEMNRARFFVIYRFDEKDNSTVKAAGNIVKVTDARQMQFTDSVPPGIYRITALDRLNNESQMSVPLHIK